ncbi:BQ5605_C002g01682 [Microbotryum silenes-dioicae]|uniref:BQ5605_C002g01682 protein n=1 Tax=Microbotryum silenes-dioicae TaxID=796604 RepID=A0A2X0M352_9BASI|nr:BQ5605_C002g01682 [Microbotryum silenes-dioicae]
MEPVADSVRQLEICRSAHGFELEWVMQCVELPARSPHEEKGEGPGSLRTVVLESAEPESDVAQFGREPNRDVEDGRMVRRI